MSLALASRFARRELRGGLRGFRIFLACLALGVAAISAVGTVRTAIEAGLEREGATLLGGDVEVEFTYRFGRNDELAWLSGIAEDLSETVDFRSMVVVERDVVERGLTQIRAVDSAYPLVGAVTLDPPIPLAEALADYGAVIEPLLADRLALNVGDKIRLGTQDFTLRAILTRYPDNGASGFALGPRTIVRTVDLADAGLIAEGTLFSTHYRLNLPADADLAALEAEAEAKFSNSGLRWRDAREGAPGIARFVDRIGAFLVLIGLSGLAVGGVGVSAAVRAYLSGKSEVIAILKTLGATRATIFQTYFLQIGALTILGVTIGVILGAGVPVVLAPLIQAGLPFPAEFAFYPAPMAEAALYGVLSALIFTLWPLARAEEIRAAALFRDAFSGGRALPATRYVIATFLLIAALLGAAIVLSGAAFLALWTASGILFALTLLAVSALIVQFFARTTRRAARGFPAIRMALAAIGGQRGEATSVVLSLGLGLAVLAAVGQIDGTLRNSISNDLPEIAPSYFFVDIQPNQIDGFRSRLADDSQVNWVDSAPMLRGVITQINGMPASDFTDHWVIQGDRGVTYAAEAGVGTTITAGEWWPANYTGPPLVSFSADEAVEMGLSLGDTITVNILGREISATITSFREVDFGTAGIGFVMSMNPTALTGAPHSWISTVYADEAAEAAILRDLGDAYPNITAIRIRDAIDHIIALLGGIATATRYGALATLITGFLVLIGAAAAGERARTQEAAILRTLGATRGLILRSFALRALILGAAAGCVALAAGIAGGWAVSTFVMQTGYAVIWTSAGAIIIGGVLAVLAANLAFAWRPLMMRPARVLRARA